MLSYILKLLFALQFPHVNALALTLLLHKNNCRILCHAFSHPSTYSFTLAHTNTVAPILTLFLTLVSSFIFTPVLTSHIPSDTHIPALTLPLVLAIGSLPHILAYSHTDTSFSPSNPLLLLLPHPHIRAHPRTVLPAHTLPALSGDSLAARRSRIMTRKQKQSK